MELNKELLYQLQDSGKEICLYSKIASTALKEFNAKKFKDFSKTSYYFWIKNKRPIPMSIVQKIMRDKKINKIEIEYFSIYGGNKIKFPEEENLYFCYILGLILGDGCLVHQKKNNKRNTYSVKITFREIREAEKIKVYFKELFDANSSIYPGKGCFDLCVYSKPLVLILNKKYQIPIGKKYKTICVPDLISKGNQNMQKAFLLGVFESDGNIYNHKNKKAIQLRQKSEYFLKEIQELLKKLNINFNQPYYDRANNSWLLWTSKKDTVDNFINKIIESNKENMPG